MIKNVCLTIEYVTARNASFSTAISVEMFYSASSNYTKFWIHTSSHRIQILINSSNTDDDK